MISDSLVSLLLICCTHVCLYSIHNVCLIDVILSIVMMLLLLANWQSGLGNCREVRGTAFISLVDDGISVRMQIRFVCLEVFILWAHSTWLLKACCASRKFIWVNRQEGKINFIRLKMSPTRFLSFCQINMFLTRFLCI